MKTLINLIAALCIFSLAISSTANAKSHAAAAVTAQSAADANHRIQTIQESLTADGYTLAKVDEQQINYIATPSAPFAWGNLVYTYSRPVPGHFQLIEKVEIVLEVHSTADGFAFPQITIHELRAE